MEIGKQSIRLEKQVYVESWASVVGKKEGEGPLAPFFDEIETDDQLGQDNWEEAESMLQQKAARLAIKKAGCCPEDIRIIFAGDLLAQSIASSFGIGELERPMYGVFGACSTMGEALSLGAITVSAGHGERVLAVTSSHFATAEKEFRFPLCLCVKQEKGEGEDHGAYHRESGRLWIKRFPEYGSMYGTSSLQHHSTEPERLWKKTRRV